MTQMRLKHADHGNTHFLTEVNKSRLEAAMNLRSFPAGAALFWEGDRAEQLFYVMQGRIKLTKSTDEGKELVLYMYQAGDLLGHADLTAHSRHSFSAETLENSIIGVIDISSVETLITQHGDFALQFMTWMGAEHRITQTKLRDLMLYGKTGALSSTLIRLANTCGEVQDNGWITISQTMTHSDLASLIGATRESVNRMLRDWKRQDILDVNHGHLVIKELSRLQQICHCEQCPMDICRL
ncbi:Crp/Fnr family transcriptional regulator [Paenibacillus sp. JSM ZJ436]|uniref:Crp/Fnr family transcriptional regulator n=1 Tax=Paenibacillus sp. JSM ZJ436 TaxID=3376190 RepID=UPI0037B0BC44